MARIQKTTTLHPHPFSKAYWQDAVKEFADVRMLVIAALIIALRVTLKMIKIPLAPNLEITPAFLANALGAMIYGPVVGAFGALISDFLGVILSGQTYFLPYALTEIAGTVIFAMYFYRAKITPTRVILSRFTICLVVNIFMTIPIDNLYQEFMYGYHNTVLTLPRILKNLFMFPIESVVLTLFLSAMQPVTYRMKLTFNPAEKMNLSPRQVVLLSTLVIVGAASVFGYLFFHYDNTSLSSAYTTQERIEANKAMKPHLLEETDDWDDVAVVTIVESAYKQFLGKEITYNVAVYQVNDGTVVTDEIWKLSKSKAAKHESLTRVADAVILIHEDTEKLVGFSVEKITAE